MVQMSESSTAIPTSIDPQRLRLTTEQATEGVLVGHRCKECDISVFGPAVFCQACSSSDLESIQFAGRGTLYSYTVVRVPPAGWPGRVPYVLGEVELPEGPHVLAEVIGLDEDEPTIGMTMELALENLAGADGETQLAVYKWRPAG